MAMTMSLKHLDPSQGGGFALRTGMPSGQFDTHLLYLNNIGIITIAPKYVYYQISHKVRIIIDNSVLKTGLR